MSRNLGRQIHRAQQSRAHLQLDNAIADVKTRLTQSTQISKDLKAELKELGDKKKEAGKSPRNSHAPSNLFKVPIPKIQGLTVKTASDPPVTTSGFPTCTSNHGTSEAVLNNGLDDLVASNPQLSGVFGFHMDTGLPSPALPDQNSQGTRLLVAEAYYVLTSFRYWI